MYDRKAFKREAKQLIKASVPHFMLVTLVYYLLTSGLNYVIGFLPDIGGFVTNILSMFLSILVSLLAMVLAVGFSNYALRLSRKEQAGMDSLFAPFSYAGRSIGMTLLVALYTVLWTMLASVGFAILFAILFAVLQWVPVLATILLVILYIAFIVAVYAITLRYAMAHFALAEQPDAGAIAAIRRSVQMMRGHMVKLFVMQLSFIGWELLVALIGCVVLGIGLFFVGIDWFMQLVELVNQDPLSAITLTETIAGRLTVWAVLGEVVALPLLAWLMPYQQTACARFYNFVSGYDYHQYMNGEEVPVEPVEQPVQTPPGGYYNPAPELDAPAEEPAEEEETESADEGEEEKI